MYYTLVNIRFLLYSSCTFISTTDMYECTCYVQVYVHMLFIKDTKYFIRRPSTYLVFIILINIVTLIEIV